MELKRPVEEIIRERRSCRTFGDRPIEPDKQKRLEDFIKEQNGSVMQMRFALLPLEVGGKIGTYGMISGARTFIVGIVDKNRENIEEFGLEFEKIILLFRLEPTLALRL
ncbi:MAG: nitroreductase family protein [Eubacteriales bacterium]